MGTMINAAQVASAPTTTTPTTVETASHYVEMLKVQLDILTRLNASPKVIDVVRQALRDAEDKLSELQR